MWLICLGKINILTIGMWNHDEEKIQVILELFVYREFLTLRLFERSIVCTSPDHLTFRGTTLYPYYL